MNPLRKPLALLVTVTGVTSVIDFFVAERLGAFEPYLSSATAVLILLTVTFTFGIAVEFLLLYIGSLIIQSGFLRKPTNARFLLNLFLDQQNSYAIVGDLDERYRLIRKEFGTRKANFWYWTQAIRSVGPIALAWAKKVVLRPVIGAIAWAVAKDLLGHDSRLASLVELYRKIRS